MAFGTPGGDQQDQWSLVFFLRHADFGVDLQNAIDAIREATHDTREIRIHTSRTDDGMGEVTISDTGTGFRAGAAERLYEPFFTTKPQGMGMGLAISRSIVELHQGRLSVASSAAGAGTAVRLALPLDSPPHEGGRHDG